jgi:putative transposase
VSGSAASSGVSIVTFGDVGLWAKGPAQASPGQRPGFGDIEWTKPQRGGTNRPMPQSLARVILHVVYSTKNRVPFLKDAGIRSRLYAYMAGVLQNIECEPILINGVEDHVHILCNLSRTVSIASLLEALKKGPSQWLKTQGPPFRNFFWQNGYGTFSVSQSNLEQVREYVAHQEKHHRTLSFQDEFRALCRRHAIEIDERYIWD